MIKTFKVVKRLKLERRNKIKVLRREIAEQLWAPLAQVWISALQVAWQGLMTTALFGVDVHILTGHTQSANVSDTTSLWHNSWPADQMQGRDLNLCEWAPKLPCCLHSQYFLTHCDHNSFCDPEGLHHPLLKRLRLRLGLWPPLLIF